MSQNLQRIVKSLRSGIKVKSLYGILKVPNPLGSTLIFHKNQYNTGYVTLQAQTNLIQGRITEKEIDLICDKAHRLSLIYLEKVLLNSSKVFGNLISFFSILLIPLPFLMFSVSGLLGLLFGILIYASWLYVLYILECLW